MMAARHAKFGSMASSAIIPKIEILMGKSKLNGLILFKETQAANSSQLVNIPMKAKNASGSFYSSC
jgi:hypothetical protein